MAEPKVKIVNPRHWLEADGALPTESVARARALRVARCIEYGGPLARGHSRETLIACRRRPHGDACLGLLVVLKQSDDAILAFCPLCAADEYLIYEWEDTLWADGMMTPVDVAAMAAAQGLEGPEPKPPPGPEARDELLARALVLLGSSLTPGEVRGMVAAAHMPSDVVQDVMSSLSGPPALPSLERFIPVIMDLWNDMRARSAAGPPVPPAPARTRSKVGANAPCPCGSGKKYKRCCMWGDSLH